MRISPAGVVCCLLFMGAVLGGCREGEQGRIMRYQKGTYLGPTVAPLPAETREALRQRIRLQGVATVAAPGGGPSLRGPGEVALTGLQGQRESTLGRSARLLRTGLPEATLDALRARARRQLPD